MSTGWSIRVNQVVAAAALAAVAACGGSNGGPTSPSGGAVVNSTGSVGPIGATITLSNGAVTPSQVTISVGQSVRVVNSDSRSRDVSSDAHPSHTNCPSLNLGGIAAGQSRDTQGFGRAGSCGFHDHNDPDNNALKGRVIIQ